MGKPENKVNKKNNKNKEILLLTFLLVITVSVNFSFILLLEARSNASVSERILKALTGNNLLDIFNKDVLIRTPEISQGEATIVTPSPETIISEPEPIPITTNTSAKTVQVDFSKPKTIYYNGKIPITIDYDKGVMITEGKEIPIIVDGGTWEDVKPTVTGVLLYDNFSYSRFEAYVDSVYYIGRETAIQDYLTKLNSRFIEMEAQTGWSSEKFYGKKLDVYIYNGEGTCGSGWAIAGEAHIGLHTQFPNPAWCKKEYYSGEVPLLNNPGELGDHWIYWVVGIHETLHSISPTPVYVRNWISEGFSDYYGFNILTDYYGNSYPDITQETADYYIKNANFSSQFGSFTEYVANDYKDKFNAVLQDSSSYSISAWMFSMMRDNHNLNWNNFYSILNNNLETLDKSKVLGDYYTDTFVIDVFGRASGLDFETQTKPIWRYDGPSGPGWGVRNWTNRSWYADLSPSLSFSNTKPYPGQSINLIANVSNYGQANVTNVSVRFYNGTNLLNEQLVNVNAGGNTIVTAPFSSSSIGTFTINVEVDEANIKIEKDDSNNNNSKNITFYIWPSVPSCVYNKKSRTAKCN